MVEKKRDGEIKLRKPLPAEAFSRESEGA